MQIVQILVYIVATIILLGLCVFVHELGHLLGGKLVGIKARVFSLGFGHGIIKKEWNGTTYQIAPFPLGGYCSFYGENAAEAREGKTYEFLTAAPWRRIVTVVAGPLFNLIFGIILFFIMNLTGYMTETNRILIPDYVKTGDYISPAHQAGMQTGDRILTINGKKIHSFGDIQNGVVFSSGKTLQIQAERGSEKKDFTLTPKKAGEKGYFTIGVVPFGDKVLIGAVVENEAAAKAGIREMDEVRAVNGVPVTGTESFVATLRASAGKKLDLTVVRKETEMTISVTPRLREIITVDKAEIKNSNNAKTTIVSDNMTAVKEGIKKGTVKVNGNTVSSFAQLTELINANKGKTITLDNAGGSYKGVFKYETSGFIGIEPAISPEMQFVQFGFGEGFVKALTDPYDFIVMNLKGIGMLAAGKLDVRENLSGPIRIAKIAGDTAYYRGVSAFIILMAKISIILMVMNLLPIPAVDGSYIIFFAIEWIIRRPLNEKLMEKIQMIGFVFILVLSVFVIFNDLTFFPFFQKFMAMFQ